MKACLLLAIAASLALSACSGGSLPRVSPAARDLVRIHGPSGGKIQHVVVIVQENRSLNNLFYGFPGARTVKYGYGSSGNKIEIKPVTLATAWDINHTFLSFIADCNGTGTYPGTDCQMNGFDLGSWSCGEKGQPKCPNANPPYSYVPHSETKPYFFMAKNYVLADEMFESNVDSSSFVSHQYLIAGQAESSVDYPASPYWGCPAPRYTTVSTLTQQRAYGKPIDICWDATTLGDEMDGAGLSWAYYASAYDGDGGIWSAYQNINHIYNGPDWTNDVITPQTNFLSDVSSGNLRALSWVTPTCENSDHAGCGSKTGPSWVASLVNSIGNSQYWNSTAIFVVWDDFGGWYDPVPPKMLDYDGLGFRIPMLVVSAYAKQGHVSHVHYEEGSILKFIEQTFGLAALAASDQRAKPPSDAFNFKQSPRAFVTIPSEYGVHYFMHQPPDRRPVDEQ